MINTKVIKKKLIDKDLNIIELANHLNLSVNTVSRWINGHNLNQIENFIDMLIFLDISINDIKKS